MKNIYYLLIGLWLVGIGPLHAQTADPLRQKLDLVFANIDKREVDTGRLLEYGTPLLPLEPLSPSFKRIL